MVSIPTIELGFPQIRVGKQLTDLLERLVRLLLTNGFDQAGLQSAMHAQFVRVRTDTRPLQVDYVNPLGQGMVSRGNKTEGNLVKVVDFVSERRTLYQTPVNIPGASVGSVQRLASLGLHPIAQVRQIVQQAIVQRRRGPAGAARAQTPDAEGHPDSGRRTPRSLRVV